MCFQTNKRQLDLARRDSSTRKSSRKSPSPSPSTTSSTTSSLRLRVPAASTTTHHGPTGTGTRAPLEGHDLNRATSSHHRNSAGVRVHGRIRGSYEDDTILDNTTISPMLLDNVNFITQIGECGVPAPASEPLASPHNIYHSHLRMPGAYDDESESSTLADIDSDVTNGDCDESSDRNSFGDIQELLRDPDVLRAMEGPCISAIHSPFAPNRSPSDAPSEHSLRDLSPLPSDFEFSPRHSANEELVETTLNPPERFSEDLSSRMRPRHDIYADFWRYFDMLCSRNYPDPTRLIPFPILSRHYVSHIRICDELSVRRNASTFAVDYAKACWEPILDRFGPLSAFQNEEARLLDHMIYTLSHLPIAISRNNMARKRKVWNLVRRFCDYLEALSKEENELRGQAEELRTFRQREIFASDL